MQRASGGMGRTWMYDLFKFIHVLTAIVWIGGSIILEVLSGRISQRLELLARVELALFVLLVADMVFKPGAP